MLTKKILKKFLKAPLSWGVIVLVVLIGVLFLNSLSFQSADNEERLYPNSNNLFVDRRLKIRPEGPDLTLIQENSLAGVSCPQIFSPKALGALIGEDIPEEAKEIIEYVVQSGDNLSLIATNFHISLNTLLWANNLSQESIIRPGQKLVILPISGLLHHVKKGDTLSEIAKTYKAKMSEIIAFNELAEEGDIFVGDVLIIPDGVQPPPSYFASNQYSAYSQIPVASSYFIYPISSPYRITQGLHWYNAIDFANEGDNCGKPVFAAAGGEVLKIKYGYNLGMGNYIRVIHPNGLITHYGHLGTILVNPGQRVSQGEIIGLIGYSGRTVPAGPAGCHLHFALYSAQGSPPLNPFAK